MFDIIFLFSQYDILQKTAQHISTIDLLNVALSCSKLHSLILQSKPIFNQLKRQALCDGHGLKQRQEFQSIYTIEPRESVFGSGRRPHHDEEIEVRLYNLKCDAVNALPCIKCAINVCEVTGFGFANHQYASC